MDHRPSASFCRFAALALCSTALLAAGGARAQAIVPGGPYVFEGDGQNISVYGFTTGGFSAYDYTGNINAVWQYGAGACSGPTAFNAGGGFDNTSIQLGIGDEGNLYGKVGGQAVYWQPGDPGAAPTAAAFTDAPTAIGGGYAFGGNPFAGSWYYDFNNPTAGEQLLGDAFAVVSVTGNRAIAYSQNGALGYWDLSQAGSLNGPATQLPLPSWAYPGTCGYGVGVSNMSLGTSDGHYIVANCDIIRGNEGVGQAFLWDMTDPANPVVFEPGGLDTTSSFASSSSVGMNDQFLVINTNSLNGSPNTPLVQAWRTSDLSTTTVLPNYGNEPTNQAFAYGTALLGSQLLGSTYNMGFGIDLPAVWDLSGGAAQCTTNPIANPGPAQTVAPDNTGNGTVQLDGSGSTHAVSWSWYADNGAVTATGEHATMVLSGGLHYVSLTVTDANGLVGMAETTVNIAVPTPGWCPASIAYAPTESTQGMLMFEDLWPSNGDLDFNDQVISYNYQIGLDPNQKVTVIEGTFSVLAIGADIDNGLYLHLPGITPDQVSSILFTQYSIGQYESSGSLVDGESEVVIPLAANTRDLYTDLGGGGAGFINTDPSLPEQAFSLLSVTVQIEFNGPVNLTADQQPFDLFIARVGDYSHQIHLPQYSGTGMMNSSLFGRGNDDSNKGINTGRWFVNADGLPFALALPEVVAWPTETTGIDLAYPDIVQFGASAGQENTDWYTSDVVGQETYAGWNDIYSQQFFSSLDMGPCPAIQ